MGTYLFDSEITSDFSNNAITSWPLNVRTDKRSLTPVAGWLSGQGIFWSPKLPFDTTESARGGDCRSCTGDIDWLLLWSIWLSMILSSPVLEQPRAFFMGSVWLVELTWKIFSSHRLGLCFSQEKKSRNCRWSFSWLMLAWGLHHGHISSYSKCLGNTLAAAFWNWWYLPLKFHTSYQAFFRSLVQEDLVRRVHSRRLGFHLGCEVMQTTWHDHLSRWWTLKVRQEPHFSFSTSSQLRAIV